MKSMNDIIHMDDWRRNGRVAPGESWYTESEIKIMMRRYAEQYIKDIWEYLPGYPDEGDNRMVSRLFEETLQEIAKEVII